MEREGRIRDLQAVRHGLMKLRFAIDEVDQQILQLLIRRHYFSLSAQRIKEENGLRHVDEKREIQIKDIFEEAAPGSSEVAEAILRWCKETYQRQEPEQAALPGSDDEGDRGA